MARQKLPVGVYASGRSHFQFRITLPKGPDGKRRQEVRGGFLTADDAYDARRKRLAELGLGDEIPDDRITVGVWLERFLESHALSVKPNSTYVYRSHARHLTPLADVRLRDLTVARVQRWLDDLRRRHSANVARAARTLLVMALNEAVRQRLIPANVASLSRSPRHTATPRVILHNHDDDRQIDRFVTAAGDDELGAAWLLMLLCQLRPGEVRGLRWSDLDLDRGIVHIDVTGTRDESGRNIIGSDPKTASSRRPVSLPDRCVRLLREHRTRQHALRLKAPPGTWHDQGLVFPNGSGGVLAHQVLARRLARLCDAADVPVITPHSLRSSGATWLRSLGEDAEVLQRRLGHTSVATTLGMYSLPRPNESRQTSERLERELRREG